MVYIADLLPKVPRLVRADAYTICGSEFESEEAKKHSVYYMTFRKSLSDKLQLSDKADDRMLFSGLQKKLARLLNDPIDLGEIALARQFMRSRKVTTKGLEEFEFAMDLWLKVVDKFNGHPPITIDAMPEGSVVYPNQPVLRVFSPFDEMGPLCSWFESTLLQTWAPSARLTAARHWLEYLTGKIKEWEPGHEDPRLAASLMMHDFGARAAMCEQELEDVASQHLYCFPGTDTFEAAFHAWAAGAPAGVGSSVWALAHRIVQGYAEEGTCYNTIYNKAPDGSIISMVADCYDYKHAVETWLLSLAKDAARSKNGKIITARPDSGDAVEQVLWTCNLAKKHGLYVEKDGMLHGTTLRFIEGDSMTFESMIEINNALADEGFAPHQWGLYGVGGFLRNSITRDDLSAKYALCQAGARDVVKVSHTPGKKTHPVCKVIDHQGAPLCVPKDHPGEDLMVNYYDGTRPEIWGPGMGDRFPKIQERVLDGFEKMPLTHDVIHPDLEERRADVASFYL